MGIKEDLAIDKLALDMECLRQPSLVEYYSRQLSEMAFTRDQCKEDLDILKAEVDSEIRAEPDEYGLPAKPTETAIKSVITCEPRVTAKTTEYLTLCKEYNILMGIKISLDHKKSSLEMLVKLYGQNYWADPSINKEDQKVYEKEVVEPEQMKELNKNPRLKKRRIKNG